MTNPTCHRHCLIILNLCVQLDKIPDQKGKFEGITVTVKTAARNKVHSTSRATKFFFSIFFWKIITFTDLKIFHLSGLALGMFGKGHRVINFLYPTLTVAFSCNLPVDFTDTIMFFCPHFTSVKTHSMDTIFEGRVGRIWNVYSRDLNSLFLKYSLFGLEFQQAFQIYF